MPRNRTSRRRGKQVDRSLTPEEASLSSIPDKEESKDNIDSSPEVIQRDTRKRARSHN